MIQNTIHSERLHKGNRMYFIDLQRATNGSLYLKIKESSKTSQGHNVNSLIIFEDDIDDFSELLQKILVKFNDLRERKPARRNSVDGLRKVQGNTYKLWTQQEDSRLEILFCKGNSTKELARLFERNEGAIISRINKLELCEKYR